MWIDRFYFWDAVFPFVVLLTISGFLAIYAWIGRGRSGVGTNRRLCYNCGLVLWSMSFILFAYLFLADMWDIAN